MVKGPTALPDLKELMTFWILIGVTGETKKEFEHFLVRKSIGDFLVLEIFSLFLLAVLTKTLLNMLAIPFDSSTLTFSCMT